jgi:hypothetical protein
MVKAKKVKNRQGGEPYPPLACSQSELPDWHEALRRAFVDRRVFFAAIIAANATDILVEELGRIFSSKPGLLPPTSPARYLEWALASLGLHCSCPLLQTALAIRKQAASRKRQEHRGVAANLILKEPQRRVILHGALHHWLPALPCGKEYPPRGHWVTTTPELPSIWAPWFANCEQADKRLPRRPVLLLDPNRIQFEIPAGVSCVIRDKDTNEIVFARYQNFSGHQGILNWAHDLVCRVASHRRNVRVSLFSLCFCFR